MTFSRAFGGKRPSVSVDFAVNGSAAVAQSIFLFLSLFLPSMTQHVVTLQLVAAVQLPMRSIDVRLSLRVKIVA